MNKTFTTKRILYVLIFFHFNQTISSFKIIDINYLLEPKSLQDFVNSYELKDGNIAEYNVRRPNADIAETEYSIKQPRSLKDAEVINDNKNLKLWNVFKKDNHDDNNYRNKILVKRIVPHGLAPTGIEYDHKFNTAYKPLVRIHKTKSINQFFNEINSKEYDPNKNKDSNNDLLFVSPKDGINRINNEVNLKYDLSDEDLLEPFTITKNDLDHKDNRYDFLKQIRKKITDTKSAESLESFQTENNLDVKDKRLQLAKEIQKKIKGIKSESNRLVAYAKVINALNNMLRSPQLVRLGQDQENDVGVIRNENEEETKPKKWIPHYPPWNYWTYMKTIHEDVCPGKQVKIGNMCIWTPPH